MSDETVSVSYDPAPRRLVIELPTHPLGVYVDAGRGAVSRYTAYADGRCVLDVYDRDGNARSHEL